MSQLNSYKLNFSNYKYAHLKIVSNFLSGIMGIGIGLMIGGHLGWF